jgi:hypothetical protein
MSSMSFTSPFLFTGRLCSELERTNHISFYEAEVVLVAFVVSFWSIHGGGRDKRGLDGFRVDHVLKQADVDLRELRRHVRKGVGLHGKVTERKRCEKTRDVG